jgi:hypothetical protein
MGIRFNCPNGHKLHVKSFLAGKRGYCPHCGTKVLIPQAAPHPEVPSEAELVWDVRPPGGTHGRTVTMERWLNAEPVSIFPDSLDTGTLESRPAAAIRGRRGKQTKTMTVILLSVASLLLLAALILVIHFNR